MPQRRNAIKELRKNRTNHLRNLDIKTELKKTVKKATAAAAAKGDNKAVLNDVYKKFDKAAKRGIMHKKTAARRKALFAKMLGAKPAAKTAKASK